MTDVPRITAEEAHRELQSGTALLVCAYADVAKCNQMRLQGAMPLAELERRRPTLSKSQRIVFY